MSHTTAEAVAEMDVGPIAQLGERKAGSLEVAGSFPARSTSFLKLLLPNHSALGATEGSMDVVLKEVGLMDAIGFLINAKKMANCRTRYISGLRAYLTLFAKGREAIPVSAFTVEMIEEWFAKRSEALSSMASNIGRLSSLFGFCRRRGWASENPCDRLERIRIERAAPKILKVHQCQTLFDSLGSRPHMIPFFALALFGGVRPEELEKITWDDIDLARGVLTVDAAASKVRRRRIVQLEPTCVEWLKLGGRLPVRRMTRRRYLAFGSKVLDFEGWPQDSMRHTAGSHLMSLHRDAGRVADLLGNSAGVLLRHYREIIRPDDCAAFWAIRPKVL